MENVNITITTDKGFTADFLREFANAIENSEEDILKFTSYHGDARIEFGSSTGGFKPVVGLRDQVKTALLNGDIIKKDMGASTYMFIIPREHKKEWEVKGEQVHNIGVSKVPGARKISAISNSEMGNIIKEMES